MNTPKTAQSRPVSVPHLVIGLIFTGLAIVWAIGEATNADLPRTAIGFPAVLIGAGLAGLLGTLVNARNRKRPAIDDLENDVEDDLAVDDENQTEDTTILEENR
jgi:hypothetical protein